MNRRRAIQMLLTLSAGMSAGRTAWALPSAGHGPGLHLVTRVHYIMGTLFEITARGEDREHTAAAIEEAFGVIRRADRIMSHYKPDSDLMRLNREGSTRAVEIPSELYSVLEDSQDYWRLTGGVFDVTMGPVVRAWWSGADRNRLPAADELASAFARTGSRHLRLSPEGTTTRAWFARPGMEVNLSAIGKGWAADRAMEILRQRGLRHALINSGNSTYQALGTDGRSDGWSIDISDPCHEGIVLGTVHLRNGSLSTTANSERYWEIRGERYSHVVDPRSGQPVQPVKSVTVVGPTSTETDALSTALFVLGRTDGAGLLRKLQRTAVWVEAGRGGGCVAVRTGPITVSDSKIHLTGRAHHG